MPPQLEVSLAQLTQGLQSVEKRTVDLKTEPWAVVEKGVIKILGGAFNLSEQNHQMVALGLSAVLGLRLEQEFQAFWFPSRETPEGAALGFPEALIMLSPFGAVVDALRRASLISLDDIVKDIRVSLGKAKFGVAGPNPVRMTPQDYARLFDPSFVQLASLDGAKLQQTLDSTPSRLSIDLRDAVSRANRLPPEVKQQVEQQLVTGLQRLDATVPLKAQVRKSPRIAELMALLFAGKTSTGCAPQEFWSDVVFPLLFVGTPAQFPPLDDEELAAAKQGVHPLFLLLETVPFQFQSPEEEGVLGAFPIDSVNLVDPSFEGAEPQRMLQVQMQSLQAALTHFDAGKTKELIKRFQAYLTEKAGPLNIKGEAEANQMLEAALVLLADVKRLSQAGGNHVVMRHLTEAEAASEAALSLVREAASGPRIILAG